MIDWRAIITAVFAAATVLSACQADDGPTVALDIQRICFVEGMDRVTVREGDTILAAGEPTIRISQADGEGSTPLSRCHQRIDAVDLKCARFITVEIGEFTEEYDVEEVEDGVLTVDVRDFQVAQRSARSVSDG
jgi:hypothetical protein